MDYTSCVSTGWTARAGDQPLVGELAVSGDVEGLKNALREQRDTINTLFLLKEGVFPALIAAVRHGHTAAAAMLIDHGARAHAAWEGLSPVWYACTGLGGGDVAALVELLLRAGASPNNDGPCCNGPQTTALFEAVRRGQYAAARLLLAAGASVQEDLAGSIAYGGADGFIAELCGIGWQVPEAIMTRLSSDAQCEITRMCHWWSGRMQQFAATPLADELLPLRPQNLHWLEDAFRMGLYFRECDREKLVDLFAGGRMPLGVMAVLLEHDSRFMHALEDATHVNPPRPVFSPTSPAYYPTAPTYSRVFPAYTPSFVPTSPPYSPAPWTPPSPEERVQSPSVWDPSLPYPRTPYSPSYCPSASVADRAGRLELEYGPAGYYSPSSPTYSPTSPHYSPASPPYGPPILPAARLAALKALRTGWTDRLHRSLRPSFRRTVRALLLLTLPRHDDGPSPCMEGGGGGMVQSAETTLALATWGALPYELVLFVVQHLYTLVI